jgi:hypothetical protein
MSEAIGLSGDFAPAFASLCASVGGGDFGVSLSLDSGAGSFDVGGGGEGGAAPAMEP